MSSSVTFIFKILPENIRLFGKINCYTYSVGDDQLCIHIQSMLVTWLNYVRHQHPMLHEIDDSNITVGVLSICQHNQDVPNSLSQEEYLGFDFYVDTLAGCVYFMGDEIQEPS